MHTYMKAGPDVFSVGYFRRVTDPRGHARDVWVPLRDFPNEAMAATYVNFLNGGNAMATGSNIADLLK